MISFVFLIELLMSFTKIIIIQFKKVDPNVVLMGIPREISERTIIFVRHLKYCAITFVLERAWTCR